MKGNSSETNCAKQRTLCTKNKLNIGIEYRENPVPSIQVPGSQMIFLAAVVVFILINLIMNCLRTWTYDI